jgi:hypothetical protein
MFSILGFIRKTSDTVDDRVDEWIRMLKEAAPEYPHTERRQVVVVPMVQARGAHRRT